MNHIGKARLKERVKKAYQRVHKKVREQDPKEVWRKASQNSAAALSAVPELAGEIGKALQNMNFSTSDFDRAMDAVYRDTHIGGASHRLYDGSHTFWGAFQAISKDSSTADLPLYERLGGTLSGLFKDAITPKGLPVIDLEFAKGIIDQLPTSVRGYVEDLASVNPKEWLPDAFSLGALLIALKKDNPEAYNNLAGSLGASALLRGSPIGLAIALIAIGKGVNAVQKGQLTPDEAIKEAAIGAVPVGAGALAAKAAVATGLAAGGGWVLVLSFSAAVGTGIVLRKILKGEEGSTDLVPYSETPEEGIQLIWVDCQEQKA